MDSVQIHRGPQGFLTSEGERIYYETYGEGEVIVLCHGFAGNHAIWYQQIPDLARSYRVVTWDQRGFGRSSNDGQQAGPAAAITDLKALLDHLGVDRADLVGQSMGGWAALGFTLRHPERVRTLTLADSISGIFTPRIEQAFDEMIQALKAAPPPDQLPIGRSFALGEQLARQSLAQAFLFEQIGSVAEPPPVNMLALLRRTAYPLEDLKKLAVPTLFVVGSQDRISPPAIIREAAAVLPRGQVVEIPDMGHSPYFEAPSLWNQAILRFLIQVRQ